MVFQAHRQQYLPQIVGIDHHQCFSAMDSNIFRIVGSSPVELWGAAYSIDSGYRPLVISIPNQFTFASALSA